MVSSLHATTYLHLIRNSTSIIIDEWILSTHLYFIKRSILSGINEKLTDCLSPMALIVPFDSKVNEVMYYPVSEKHVISTDSPSCPTIVSRYV